MIIPQLAKSAEVTSLESFIHDERWVMEQKLDGNRILLMSPGMDMPPTAITRNGNLYSKKIPTAVQNFRFPEGEWVLDGELVGDTYWVFDMPVFPAPAGIPTPLPLWARRAALETFMDSVASPFRLVPQAKDREDKIALADQALANNFEGLLLKKADSPYRSGGRTEEWLKVKFVSTADVIVMGVRTDGKDSVDLGLVNAEDRGAVIPVGRASLIGKEKAGLIQMGDVLEVRYLYTGAGGRLYQPTILRKRTDKFPHECDTAQLKHVNKEVLEAL
jgi:bifunctional non-homologous end joining protein LigD